MDSLLNKWSTQVQSQFDDQICASPSLSSQASAGSDRLASKQANSYAFFEYVVQWFQREVNLFLAEQVGAQFWSHFDWFTVAATQEESFIEQLEQSLLDANKELMQVKTSVLLLFESLFDAPMLQTSFAQIDLQQRFVRVLHHLETLWHLAVIPSPMVILGQKSVDAGARAGLWKKLVFHYLSHHFDLLRTDTSTEVEDAEKELPTPTDAFSDFITQLNALNLVDTCGDVLRSLLLRKIQDRVNSQHAGVFDKENQLEEAQKWVEKDCLNFLARVHCPTLSLDTLASKIDSTERFEKESRHSLRASQDSDLEDHFDLASGLKNVPSYLNQLPQLGYPARDPTSSIKKPNGRRGQATPMAKRSHFLESDSDSDSDDLAPSSLVFMSKTPSRLATIESGSSGSSLGSLAMRMSNSIPSSPTQKVPISPIPLSSMNSSVQELIRNKSLESIDMESRRVNELCGWKHQLFKFLVESFSKLRISEVFSLIVDYPDSLPAIHDLKLCMDTTQEFGAFVTGLRAAFHKRLLHPGAMTSDIVTTYISTIKSIREIDPSNVLLSHVTVDLKEYLRQRPDSLRCLVSLLTDEGSDSGVSLIAELEESSSGGMHATPDDVDSEEDESGELWTPAPIITAPTTLSAHPSTISAGGQFSMTSRSKDLISAIIAIHGSKDHFIAEYAVLMASRLLEMSDFATENEVRNLELLKLKFGENSMHQCEVMLKDMAEAKRTNVHIARTLKEESRRLMEEEGDEKEDEDNEEDFERMTNVILSYMFWPSHYQPSTVFLPPRWQKIRDMFVKKYGVLKSSRNLQWYDNMGFVELELEFGGDESDDGEPSEPQRIEFRVTPLQASIVMQFEEKEVMTLSELTKRCQLSEEQARKGISIWIGNGVILEPSPQVYRIADRIDSTEALEEADGNEEEADANEPNDEEWIPYILAMLKNLGVLPLSRMHQMMTNANDEYNLTLQQLSELITKLVKDEKVESRNGQFALKKQAS